MLLADVLGFLGASQQRFGIAEEVEQLRPQRQGEGKVERMAAAPRVGFHLLVRRQRLVRVTHDPQILRAIDALAGKRVVVGEKRQPPMPIGIVELADQVARLARGGEIAQPEVTGGRGAVPDDFEAVVAVVDARLHRAVGPAQQFLELVDAHIMQR